MTDLYFKRLLLATGTLTHGWWNSKIAQPLCCVWQNLIKLNILRPCSLAIPLLDIYLKLKMYVRERLPQKCARQLFHKSPSWEQLDFPPTGEWKMNRGSYTSVPRAA